jgi:DNA-binding cell septation regulator SpoVG
MKSTTAPERQGKERNMIVVENLKAITNAGSLRGFATINIAGKIRISDVRIIQQGTQAPWVSMPSRAYEQNGQRKWAATVELLDDKLKREVSQAVLEEFAKMEPAKAAAAPDGW